MENKEIKNSRNPESNSFLLDIKIHNSIDLDTADSLTKDIASYINDREKVESCSIRFINPRKGETTFVVTNNDIRRMIDFSWDDNKVTEANILYPDGENYSFDKDELKKLNEEIYSIPGSFIESAMDMVTFNFVNHLVK